jgi:hypothetical protein
MTSDPKLPLTSEPPAVEISVEGSHEAPANRTASHGRTAAPEKSFATAHLWLRRLGVLLFVFLCATLGVMLMIVPWRPEWSDNSLLFPYPAIRELAASGFVRGVVTGLGLLNVWIGFWEAIQYREE